MEEAIGNVTCMGLGRMGSALARCFIRHGHKVTVWNRDPEKRKAFEGSAAIAATPAEACAASDLIIISVATYGASDSFLHIRATSTRTRAGSFSPAPRRCSTGTLQCSRP